VSHLFGIYFRLPDGAIWGNVVAEPVCLALAGIAAFLLRHRIGRGLAGWWHKHTRKHQEELIDQRLAVMRAGLLAELKAHTRQDGD
jgi:hypothetical protein